RDPELRLGFGVDGSGLCPCKKTLHETRSVTRARKLRERDASARLLIAELIAKALIGALRARAPVQRQALLFVQEDEDVVGDDRQLLLMFVEIRRLELLDEPRE